MIKKAIICSVILILTFLVVLLLLLAVSHVAVFFEFLLAWSAQFGLYVISIVMLIITLVAAAVFCYTIRMLYRQFVKSFIWKHRVYSSGAFDAEGWKKEIEESDGDHQTELLLRTGHEALKLSPEEFHRRMVEILPRVKESALNCYWMKRRKLRKILKQQQNG